MKRFSNVMNIENKKRGFSDPVVKLFVCLLVIFAAYLASQKSTTPQLSKKESLSMIKIREQPYNIQYSYRNVFSLSPSEKERFWEMVNPSESKEFEFSYFLHYLSAYSISSRHSEKIAPALEFIQPPKTTEQVFGAPVFIKTMFGAAPITARSERSQEAHRDQGLATFALLGLPSSFPIMASNETCCIQDLVKDCVANFYLKEKELSWTAIALALYLSPAKEWTNRYGESCSFDDLVEELLKRRFENNSCAGVHLLEALSIIYEVSLTEPILSAKVQQKLGSKLQVFLKTIISSQNQDGSWSIDWFVNIPGYSAFTEDHVWTPIDDAESKTLATAHLLEWMLSLPQELFQTPDEVFINAGNWILKNLKDKTSAKVHVCPYIHAVVVLEALSKNSCDR